MQNEYSVFVGMYSQKIGYDTAENGPPVRSFFDIGRPVGVLNGTVSGDISLGAPGLHLLSSRGFHSHSTRSAQKPKLLGDDYQGFVCTKSLTDAALHFPDLHSSVCIESCVPSKRSSLPDVDSP